VVERLRLEPEAVIGKARSNLLRWIGQRGQVPALLEWLDLINDHSPSELELLIVADDERGMRLRQSSPFAGVLEASEIWEIKRGHAAA
jgi:hypothetical protein